MLTQLKKAINHLIFQESFIGSLLPRLQIIEDNGPGNPTMSTNGKCMWWNREFTISINKYETQGVVAHEVFHCIFLHMFRRGSREIKKWGLACDYAVNPFVLTLVGCTLPEGAYIDTNRFPLGTPAEKIYEQLDDSEVPENYTSDLVEGDKLTRLAEEIDWKGAVAVAAKNAKQAGALSVALENAINFYINPKLPWQQLLYTWAVRSVEFATNWTKSNRHYRTRGIYLPGKRKVPTGSFILTYDVSGSMSDKAVRDSLSECAFIVNEINPACVILIEHDAKITKVRKFERADELPTTIQLHGRGGTDFNPVFEYINDLDEMPDAVILFTDGYGPHPEYPPEYPVLWVMVETTPDIQMTFGEQIWLD
jgi:predicted metal-dependent peptidase